MAPKTTTPATPPTPPVAAPTTTIGGHAVQVLAFIPDNKADMRGQAQLLSLLADLADGTKSIVDLAPYLKGIEVKASYTRKRFTKEEAEALLGTAPKAAETEAKTPATAEEAIAQLAAAGSAAPEEEARLNYPDLFPTD